MEDLHGRFEFVVGEGDDVGVGAVAEHHGLLLHRPAQRAEIVAKPGGPLELQRLGRLGHLPLKPADHDVGAAREEVAELLDDLAVFLGRHPADARRRALADVAEQARPADLGVPAEHACRAGPRGEHPEQQVERLADRPGVRVGAEIPHALLPRAPVDVQARELLVQRHREHRIRLVVAVPDVEPRVELLDPVVFELECLHLGAHHGPLDARRRGDHLPGPRMQAGEVREVGVQPAAQALRLADVDDPAVRVAELVHAGRVGDGSRRGSVGGRVGHAVQPMAPR
ncbi:hypothetical protein SAXI111661_09050 [Saccharomonospora xinjiangensis]